MNPSFSFANTETWVAIGVPIVAAVIVLALGFWLSRPAQRAVVRWLPRANAGTATIAPLLGQAARYGIIIFAIVTALGFIGVPQASILAVLGAASLAIALALQNTLSNIAAGIMLAWIRPIAVGEYITGDGVEGVVVEIGLFGTRLRSTSGLFVFTPNNKLWNGAITNHSREPRRRIDVNVTLPDSANIARARKVLLGITAHDKRVLNDPAPIVIVNAFGKDTVSLQMRAWVPTLQYRDALRGLTEEAKLAINKMLAAGDGGTADVQEAADPHLVQAGTQTPDAA
ncbi:MAG TPA: mechanosensitive ion channel family protein [Devosia sp.]|nr:mechanosensitive ion channel family protein [Devosia sp.]